MQFAAQRRLGRGVLLPKPLHRRRLASGDDGAGPGACGHSAPLVGSSTATTALTTAPFDVLNDTLSNDAPEFDGHRVANEATEHLELNGLTVGY